MGCCTTKQSTQKKALYEDKSHKQPIQEIQVNKNNENRNQQVEENKTTMNTDNKSKNEIGNPKQEVKLFQSEQTPTPKLNSEVINNQISQTQQNGVEQKQNVLLAQQNIIMSSIENRPDIKKVGSLYLQNEDKSSLIKQIPLAKKEDENVDPNSLKGVSQTLSIQQMRLSKVDKQSTLPSQLQHQQKQLDKSLPISECDLQDEPATNMINYTNQQIQNKTMKDNILNKHMKSILSNLKYNDSVSKSCYSTPPILLVDTDVNNKGEWMQVETFGIYGKAEEQNDSKNFMND